MTDNDRPQLAEVLSNAARRGTIPARNVRLSAPVVKKSLEDVARDRIAVHNNSQRTRSMIFR